MGNMEERKSRSKAGVGERAVQIELPLWEDSSDTASAVEEDRAESSRAMTPTGTKRERKRKWYSLLDKVHAPKNLRAAWERVRRNKGSAGSDGQTIAQFEANLEANLSALEEALRTKRYRPRPVRRVEIPKPDGGVRALGIPSVRDRIVQQALLQVMSPIFEAKFSNRSHGFRPERGCQTALAVVDQAVAHGYSHVVDADIEKFFDHVDHALLLRAVNEEISDGGVLRLIRMFLKSGVLLDSGETEATGMGTPQGGPISPLLANIYLHPFDRAMEEAGIGLVRYADDFVLFTKSRERAEEALALAREALATLKLRPHPEKTRVATVDEGFAFLGFHYHRDRKGRLQKVVSRKSRQRFRDAIRERTKRHAGQKRPKAKRCTAARLKRNQRVQGILGEVNLYLRGWYAYFRQTRTNWQDYYDEFDRFVRRRLRCLISGRYAKGRWQQILDNALFEEIGLLSLHRLATRTDPPLSAFQPPRSG